MSQLGSQMTLVAVPVQVYELTKSSLAVGMLGLVGLVPLIVFGLYGGALADALDRRRLAMHHVEPGCCVTSAVLVTQSVLALNQLWLIYVVIAVQAALFAIDNPTRNAIIPRLVPRERLPAANALAQTDVQPRAHGWTAHRRSGDRCCRAADRVRDRRALVPRSALRAVEGCRRCHRTETRGDAGLRSVVEGLRFVATRTVLMVSFLADIAAMVLVMPKAVFPELADKVLGGGADTVGLLFAALGVGGALAAAARRLDGPRAPPWRRRAARGRRLGPGDHRLRVCRRSSGSVWSSSLLAGASDLVSAVFRTSILQSAAPDEMRGRLFGLNIVVVTGGPRLADVRAGAVAVLFSPVMAVVFGGIACLVALVLLAMRFPAS